MKARQRFALLALASIAVFAMGAEVVSYKFVKTTGGSTGDSSIVAVDTSAVQTLATNISGWVVVVQADSATSYRTLVSADGAHWSSVDFDTCAIAGGGASPDGGLESIEAQFAQAVEKAQAGGAVEDLKRIQKAAEAGTWQASGWRLER